METSHSSCCLLSNWSPYKSVKNPAAAAVERQTNHPMYTNHHGNIHLSLLLFFVFTGGFSGETKGSVDSMEFLLFDGPGETKKIAIVIVNVYESSEEYMKIYRDKRHRLRLIKLLMNIC